MPDTLTLSVSGYRPCHNAEEVIAEIGYDADADLENSADSVFCSHGAGYLVGWQEVPFYMHLPAALPHRYDFEEEIETPAPVRRTGAMPGASDDELMKIYERTYGKIQRDERKAMRRDPKTETLDDSHVDLKAAIDKEYLLVDGYNIIFAWDSLKALAQNSLDHAREVLMNRLMNYQGYRKCEVILVFDAYKCKGHGEETVPHGNITVVYTREAETADSYIERVSKKLIRGARVRVATSDALEQLIILGNGAIRISAREFEAEMNAVEAEIRDKIGE